jgi:hypothetical protein
MSNSDSKKTTGKKPVVPKTAAVKPVLYKDIAKDKPEEKTDPEKAFDWTKKYSYDPAGRTYIRSMPGEDVIDPKDDPDLANAGS